MSFFCAKILLISKNVHLDKQGMEGLKWQRTL